MIQTAGEGVKEIPIPGIIRIPTYGTDYLPVRRERNTYIRPKGALRDDGGGGPSGGGGGGEREGAHALVVQQVVGQGAAAGWLQGLQRHGVADDVAAAAADVSDWLSFDPAPVCFYRRCGL